jgi:hypothetical protein
MLNFSSRTYICSSCHLECHDFLIISQNDIQNIEKRMNDIETNIQKRMNEMETNIFGSCRVVLQKKKRNEPLRLILWYVL